MVWRTCVVLLSAAHLVMAECKYPEFDLYNLFTVVMDQIS